METTVYDMLQRFGKLNIKDEIILGLEDSAEIFTDMQREQMLRGERSDGKPIFRISTGSDEYSPAYAKKKGRKKPIDLRDTGEFQSELFMDVREEELFIDSADSKSGMLQKDYGEEIMGLQDDPMSEFAEKAAEKIIVRVENILS